ncbi:YchJ family metal-binding protein [Phytomonospora sp. NPDC050363]|uniref:YchJ family protein n=1 Tax=Phytomonospora sp. NPDC050363 TaxID=3155642 RepID=UPI0034071566
MQQSREACPCGLGVPYSECCGRWHRQGQEAPTAELLMRSRFTAFAIGDAPYLRRTWHASGRPGRIDLDPGTRFTRLEILGTTGGGLFDKEGTVHFRAHYVEDGHAGVVEEDSRFVREGGRWLYVAAID